MRIGAYARTHVEILGSVDMWACNPLRLSETSNVVSGGAGQSVTFEKTLVSRTGCNVHLFDPSPTGAQTMQRELPHNPKIHFLPMGLAGCDGLACFAPPDTVEEGSWKQGVVGSEAGQFPCRSVSAYAREKGFGQIDLLKLDIEGFEYEVLDDVLCSGLRVDQICVEFHTHKTIRVRHGILDIAQMLWRLRNNGFHMTYLKEADFSFFHRRIL